MDDDDFSGVEEIADDFYDSCTEDDEIEMEDDGSHDDNL